MPNDAIVKRLVIILRESAVEEHDWDAIDGDTTIESLGIDSLTILELLYDIDQEFGINLEASEVVNLKTMGEIADLLEQPGV